MEINSSESNEEISKLELDRVNTQSVQSNDIHSGTRPKRKAGIDAAKNRKMLIDNDQF